ncbi:uncharacterized protein LOC107464889 [Arachis duranensis]|uniref:Uncharacterized protein LOC107464889 n=1 Tax=Arachis duranensis TaxID=130453 RepID=A0A6P4BGA4_ARADU|nr:uncharacterized protein LOC107464889 [Arachis duranensis]XP_057733540.1 uncharacterized protein LOC130948713 [Arachis stenosperma]
MPLTKKNSDLSHRAWKLLRVSLLWARKGGVFKRRLAMELRLVPKYLKRLGHTTTSSSQSNQIHYFERELSFDKTPIFHVKMYRPNSSMRFLHLPHIPCINPHVDFDYDFEDDNADHDIIGYHNNHQEEWKEDGEEQEEGIDKRAEEFIAKFYEQMKLQRQISYLQYNGTPNRDTTTC